MELIIDLKNKQRDKKNIALSWDISFPAPKSICSRILGKMGKRTIQKTVKLSVNNINVPDEIICDKDHLFFVEENGNIYGQENLPIDIALESSHTSFRLFIDQAAIKDCTERQQRVPKKYTISCDLVARDEDDNDIDSKRIKIDIQFAVLQIEPSVRINIDENNIQYSSSLSEMKVGEVVAWIEEDYQYTPQVNVRTRIHIYDQGKDLGDIIYFKKNGKRVSEKNALLSPGRKNIQRFDAYLDFTQINNPIADRHTLTIAREANFSMEYSPEINRPLNELMENIDVLKDQQGTEIKVKFIDESRDIEEYVENGKSVILPLFNFVPKSKLSSVVNVDILNIATDNSRKHAGLTIKNLTINDNIPDDVRILDTKGHPMDCLTHIDGDDCEDMQGGQGLFIRNGQDMHSMLSVEFCPKEITDTIGMSDNGEFCFTTQISFDYCENKDGIPVTDSMFKPYVINLERHLKLEPYPEWLCVDYGSSAIVCKYDKEVVDLKAEKDDLYADDDNGFHANLRKDTLEKGTKFLSSDILFSKIPTNQDISSLCTQQTEKQPYNSLAVCLSPTSALIKDNVKMQLPCLKILVGNEFLPSNRDYNTYRYPWLNEEKNKVEFVEAGSTREKPKSLLRVSNVFEEAYNELFRYFLSSAIKDEQHLNKLVLTYPNTYTPVHLKVLRGIVSKTFKHIRPGYLNFVSESDAVAAYYVDNWNLFHPGYDISSITSETVMVYDMGAGTLDVTVFRKDVTPNGKVNVEILGKLGTGKAGNYLDFTLAQILCQKYLKQVGKNVATTNSTFNNQDLMQRLELKQVIKQDIKPNLKRGDTIRFQFAGTPYTISADDIINHEDFEEFIISVTYDIIDQLEKYLDDEDLQIDTVIMSGRSCKLEEIREKLKYEIESSIGPEAQFVTLDKGDLDKTIVVEGAMAQVNKFSREDSVVTIKSRRLNASYGLVFQGLGGRMRYVELLNHNNIPFTVETGAFKAQNVHVKGTGTSSYVRLVQTYMSEKDTESKYNDGDFEFISDMEEYDMTDFNHSDSLNAQLRLDKDNNIKLYINGRVTQGSAPNGVDLTSEITKQSIWPVTI